MTEAIAPNIFGRVTPFNQSYNFKSLHSDNPLNLRVVC